MCLFYSITHLFIVLFYEKHAQFTKTFFVFRLGSNPKPMCTHSKCCSLRWSTPPPTRPASTPLAAAMGTCWWTARGCLTATRHLQSAATTMSCLWCSCCLSSAHSPLRATVTRGHCRWGRRTRIYLVVKRQQKLPLTFGDLIFRRSLK